MTDHRNIVTHETNEWQYGYRESRKDAVSPWVRDLHSDYVLNLRKFWFQKRPVDIMREHMGFETTAERANEFERASDNDAAVWWYLGAASLKGSGDEVLKWIMGALATELNIQSKPFTYLAKLMPPHTLAMFVSAITDGRIDRTFAKAIFTELLKIPRIDIETFNALITKPEYKAISSDDLEPIIDKVIAENPDQFEKAKLNPKLVQFFVGQVMRATSGKAPPPKVIEIMNRKLTS